MKTTDGGQAFPRIKSSRPAGDNGLRRMDGTVDFKTEEGMSLRDYFAAKADEDPLAYACLSRIAKETIVGREHPAEPRDQAPQDQIAAYQIDRFKWEADLRAILKYRMADSMLAARQS